MVAPERSATLAGPADPTDGGARFSECRKNVSNRLVGFTIEVGNRQVLEFVETQEESEMGTEAQALPRNSQMGEEGIKAQSQSGMLAVIGIACAVALVHC